MASEPSPLRPTKGVVVRAIRDMLRHVVAGTDVLDLFAGTARVGRGLLEEGAQSVTAVDLREVPDDLPEELTWVRKDVLEYVDSINDEKFDIIYLDPPYDSNLAEEILPKLSRNNLLSSNGIVAVETGYKTTFSGDEIIDGELYLMRKRNYGRTDLWIYQTDREEPGYRE